MSAGARARQHLDYYLAHGVIREWVDVCDGQRYEVWTSDGKPHTWTPAQIAAFHAGYCAGRDHARDQLSDTA